MLMLDHRSLRYFVAVAEELHFGNAARRLHLAQPSLSQQIASLETDLGVKLFVRTKRSVEITPAGQQLLHDARTILADITKTADRVRAAAMGQSGTLHIGLNYSSPLYPVVSQLFRKFIKLHPKVRLDVRQDTGAKQLESLYHGSLDLCFLWPTKDDVSPDTTFIPLVKEDVQLFTTRDSDLAKKKKVTAADLRGHTVFLMPWQTRTAFYEALLASCRKENFIPQIRTDIIQMPFIMNIIAAGQGIGFIPKSLSRIQPDDTKFIPCNFLPAKVRDMSLSLAYRTNDSSPLVQNFVKIV